MIKVPSDRLSLAVFIGCEPDDVTRLSRFAKFRYETLLVCGDLIDGCEVMLHVYTKAARLEVTYVSIAREHFVISSEEFANRLRLCGGLYYY